MLPTPPPPKFPLHLCSKLPKSTLSALQYMKCPLALWGGSLCSDCAVTGYIFARQMLCDITKVYCVLWKTWSRWARQWLYDMLVQFQNNSEADERNVRGVMPTKFCTGNVCCNNHKAQNPREKSDCKEFVIIGKKLKVNLARVSIILSDDVYCII